MLAEVSRTLNSTYDYNSALEKSTDAVLEAVGAERGLILLERGGEVPAVEVARGKKALSQRGLLYSETVVNQVLKTGEPVLSLDAQGDTNFDAATSLRELRTVSVMCVPLRSRNRNLGLLYLDSSTASGLFNQADLELVTIIADLAASAIERAQYFAQLVQSEKMSALGTLVAGLAHELRNPLNSILGLGQAWQDGEHDEKDPENLVSEARRCHRLVSDLLRLARDQAAVLGETNLNTVVDRAGSLVSGEFRNQKVELRLATQPDLPPIKANAEHLVQVLLNLLTNSLAALEDSHRGKVTVTTSAGEGVIKITVSDNGPGIPPENLRRIFDPFFTTKEDGTGLGLSIIQRLVEDHGGFVRAGNLPEGGAIFTIEIPTQPG